MSDLIPPTLGAKPWTHSMSQPTFRLAIDVGGTFTDVVLIDDQRGKLWFAKVLSTPDDPSRGSLTGVAEILERTDTPPSAVRDVAHATTVATNAVLEGKGARTGLIATAGFRDVLEMGREARYDIYDLGIRMPPPLAPRRRRMEVSERITFDGDVLTPLDEAEVEANVRRLVEDEDIQSLAICLLHGYAHPDHELKTAAIAKRLFPNLSISVSSEVSAEIREYERVSTTVVDAYVKPLVQTYVGRLNAGLKALGTPLEASMMLSHGGIGTATDVAENHPVRMIESGPAAGAIAAAHFARRALVQPDAIAFDMGGTTAKAALVIDGRAERAEELQVGGEAIQASRLLTGQGYSVKTRAIDLAEVGAGGGSIVWIDAGGAMQIGPESAGASPGPVAYGMGGDRPTVTDANLILGYLNSAGLAGGDRPLDLEAARAVFQTKVADPLGLSLEDAAFGARRIAVANMMRAIRAVTVERGRDPRSAALFAFGGNGPLFGWDMATALGMNRVIAPPAPGLFSAFGLIYAEVEHHYGRTLRRVLANADASEIEVAWAALETEAIEQLVAEGFNGPTQSVQRTASLRYKGQTHELEVDWTGPISADKLDALAEAFGEEHARVYGHRAGAAEPVELITLRVSGRGLGDRPPLARASDRSTGAHGARLAYFGPKLGWLETPILSRKDLIDGRKGPFIVEEYDATCLAPPGVTGEINDATGAIILR